MSEVDALARLWEPTPAWFQRAECRGLDAALFHPLRGEPCEGARRVCDVCPVSSECLEWALIQNFRIGMWGGTSEKERVLTDSIARDAA